VPTKTDVDQDYVKRIKLEMHSKSKSKEYQDYTKDIDEERE